jgi:hypothetical protein
VQWNGAESNSLAEVQSGRGHRDQNWHSHSKTEMRTGERWEWKCELTYGKSVDDFVGSGKGGGNFGPTNDEGYRWPNTQTSENQEKEIKEIKIFFMIKRLFEPYYMEIGETHKEIKERRIKMVAICEYKRE